MGAGSREPARPAYRRIAPAAALAATVLGLAACSSAPPAVPVTPAMPPLGEGAGEARPASHWDDARSTCTGTEPPLLLGLMAGGSYRIEIHAVPGQDPPAVEAQRDDGTRRSFRRLQAAVEGHGDASRLVVRDGEDLTGRPKVLCWAGTDRRFHFPGERCDEELAASRPAEAAPAAPAAPAVLAAPAERARTAAGRPLAWWGDRLTALRRDGPPELYRVALQRARAAGLSVTEGPDAVRVADGEAP